MKLDEQMVDQIHQQWQDRDDRLLSPYACKSDQAIRLVEEDPDPIRSSFFLDTDRILHSMAYSRYIDKTQVFSEIKNDHVTHRVLHVQLVAKVARVIGRTLSLNEDLIEAIALGHDLGHVPFGHEGERFLDRICQEEGLGFFVHNAQSVRAVQMLERNGQGLNLCLQTLDGILCHNGELFSREYRPKRNKGIANFQQEVEGCFKVEKFGKNLVPMTLEGCLVRLCDILAYIGRDVEDAIRIHMIKREDLPKEVVEILGDNNSQIMSTMVSDIIQNSLSKDYLEFTPEIYESLLILRNFNYQRIYCHPKNQKDLDKVDYIFRHLYQMLLKDLKDKNSFIYRWASEKNGKDYRDQVQEGRIVVDYISGMTDRYFLNLFKDRVFPMGMGYRV